MRGTLVGCFFVSMGCGTLYVYSAYAPQLSDRLGLTATQMSAIGMTGNLSMSLSGPFAGRLVDSYGFTIPILVSLLCNLIGYTIIRISFMNAISSQLLLTLALILIGIGSTFAFSSTVKSAALNFPKHRGIATSIPMAGYGLSAFVVSTVANKAVPGDTGGFLSLLTFLPSSLFIIFGPVVAASDLRSAASSRNRHLHEDPPIEMHSIGTDDDYVGLVTAEGLTQQGIESRNKPMRPDLTGIALFKTPSFWCYAAMLGCIAGMGQTYIYSCGYMVKALAIHEDEHIWQAKQVAVISLANCAGRILSGILSDTAYAKMGLSRTVVLSIAITLCLTSQIMARLITRVQHMTILSIISGLFYGVCFGSYPGVIGDAFGLKHFSANWGFVALSPIPVAYFLTLRMGSLYDAMSKDGVCIGHKCFSSAFSLTIGLTVLLYGVFAYALYLEYKQSRKKVPIY